MYLNIILTILTLILLSIVSLVVIWWFKYGKKMVDSFSSMRKTIQNNKTTPMDMSNFTNALNMLKNLNNNKNDRR